MGPIHLRVYCHRFGCRLLSLGFSFHKSLCWLLVFLLLLSSHPQSCSGLGTGHACYLLQANLEWQSLFCHVIQCGQPDCPLLTRAHPVTPEVPLQLLCFHLQIGLLWRWNEINHVKAYCRAWCLMNYHVRYCYSPALKYLHPLLFQPPFICQRVWPQYVVGYLGM